jgi:hypothetical protein
VSSASKLKGKADEYLRLPHDHPVGQPKQLVLNVDPLFQGSFWLDKLSEVVLAAYVRWSKLSKTYLMPTIARDMRLVENTINWIDMNKERKWHA